MAVIPEKRVPPLRFRDDDEEDYPKWEEKFVRDICEINPSTGGLPNRFTYIDLDSVYQGMLVKENKISKTSAPSRAQRILKENDVLFQTVRPYQQNNFFFNLTGDYVASTGYAQLRTKSSPLFLYYLLHEQKFVRKVLARCTGTSYPAINSSDIGTIRIHLPDEKEQQKIAAFLSAVDTKIEQLNRKKSLLEQYKKGMMQKLFRQEIRFKDVDRKDYPDWEVKSFGEISKVKRGASPRPITSPRWFSNNSKIGWVRISDVTSSSKYLKETAQYLSDEGVRKSRFIPKGNMIMSICATIGKPIYTDFDVCIHDGFVVFEDLKVNKEFIYYFLEKVQKHWYRYGQPGTQVNLNSDIVSNEKIKIPIELEQQKIADFLSAIDRKIDLVAGQIEQARTFKQGLLQQMFI